LCITFKSVSSPAIARSSVRKFFNIPLGHFETSKHPPLSQHTCRPFRASGNTYALRRESRTGPAPSELSLHMWGQLVIQWALELGGGAGELVGVTVFRLVDILLNNRTPTPTPPPLCTYVRLYCQSGSVRVVKGNVKRLLYRNETILLGACVGRRLISLFVHSNSN